MEFRRLRHKLLRSLSPTFLRFIQTTSPATILIWRISLWGDVTIDNDDKEKAVDRDVNNWIVKTSLESVGVVVPTSKLQLDAERNLSDKRILVKVSHEFALLWFRR